MGRNSKPPAVKPYDEYWDGGRAPLDIDRIPSTFPGEIDFLLAGRRIKDRRIRLKMKLAELADHSGLTRQTVAKVEQGQPFKYETLRRIQFVLGMYWIDIVGPEPDFDYATLHNSTDVQWKPAYSKSLYTSTKTSTEGEDLNEAAERKRLGKTGLQPFFMCIFPNHLPGGTIRSPGLMELHQPSWFDQHPGEECIYCLRGTVKMVVRDQEFLLTTGSCLVFNAFEPHKYIPVEFGENGEAPLIFVCLAVSQEDAIRGVRTWPTDKEIETIQRLPK